MRLFGVGRLHRSFRRETATSICYDLLAAAAGLDSSPLMKSFELETHPNTVNTLQPCTPQSLPVTCHRSSLESQGFFRRFSVEFKPQSSHYECWH